MFLKEIRKKALKLTIVEWLFLTCWRWQIDVVSSYFSNINRVFERTLHVQILWKWKWFIGAIWDPIFIKRCSYFFTFICSLRMFRNIDHPVSWKNLGKWKELWLFCWIILFEAVSSGSLHDFDGEGHEGKSLIMLPCSQMLRHICTFLWCWEFVFFCLEAAEETEEEKAKRLVRSKMREEYYFAIHEEGKKISFLVYLFYLLVILGHAHVQYGAWNCDFTYTVVLFKWCM